ncbi:MAG TPA: xanthine dehydrogenase accessory protein XdhC [Steroidobacteraceae bacterium]|jgi:xanthine dehydrogenase accessory factor|nr:xanthine dehydrogenase accessory protein XdhC [Steroidobacteraceae bacterium]
MSALTGGIPCASVPETAGEQWLQPLRDWPHQALRMLQSEPAVVRIVMATVQGSAPREAGVCMLVGQALVHGTVGGGQLEWQALSTARLMLGAERPSARIHRFVLGGDIGQCCGGVVELWIERYTADDAPLLERARASTERGAALMRSELSSDGIERQVVCDLGSGEESDRMLRSVRERAPPRLRRTALGAELLERLDNPLLPVWLYGAGHVGQALARALMPLPLRLTWIDSREDLLPKQVPDTVQCVHTLQPLESVASAPAGARFLVMTHSHSLDYSLCRAILTRADFAWIGLIGSNSKSARFRSRLARHGVDESLIARLVCPIGVRGIDSKWPAAIAIAVAAQLLQGISADAIDERIEAPPQAAAGSCGHGSCEDCHPSDKPVR